MKETAIACLHLLALLYLTNIEGTHAQTKCDVSDTACLTTQAQGTLQKFVKGIPELGLPKTDELFLDDVISGDVYGFYYNWTNIRVEGIKNAIIDSVSIDLDIKTLRVSFETTVNVNVDYAAKGVFLSVMPVFGQGTGIITIKRMQVDIFSVFNIIKDENDKDVMDLSNYYYGFNAAGGVNYNFANLYDGDVKKSEAFLKLCNVNWRIVVVSYNRVFSKKMTDKFFEAIKIYMRSRPLEELAIY